MTRIIAIARKAPLQPAELARAATVLGCAAALILAGRALPF